MNHARERRVETSSTAQVSLTFVAHAHSQMTCASPAVLYLAGGGKAEPLLGAFMRFHLWHTEVAPCMRRTLNGKTQDSNGQTRQPQAVIGPRGHMAARQLLR